MRLCELTRSPLFITITIEQTTPRYISSTHRLILVNRISTMQNNTLTTTTKFFKFCISSITSQIINQ